MFFGAILLFLDMNEPINSKSFYLFMAHFLNFNPNADSFANRGVMFK